MKSTVVDTGCKTIGYWNVGEVRICVHESGIANTAEIIWAKYLGSVYTVVWTATHI